MTVKTLLKVDDVTIERGGLPLASGLSLTISAGEAVVLRGPNGSGKTTLLRTIAGLQPPSRGTIDCEPDTIAYGAHADGLKATLTVSENLTFWARLHGQGEIASALSAFDLDALADRPAGALSAGQKRRLGLARLLVTGRPVWALDEPTVSLDATSVALFADAVATHLAKGGAALIATHIDLGIEAEVLQMADFPPDTTPGSAGFDEAFL